MREHLKPGEFYKKRDEVGEGAFRRLRADASRIFCIAWRKPIRSGAMRSGCRGRSGTDRKRRNGLSNARGSWRWSSARRIRCCWAAICWSWAFEPGPTMGEITRAVYEMQLDGRVRTLDEAIAEAEN